MLTERREKKDRIINLDRGLPFSDEAEKGVISCIFQTPELITEAQISIPPEYVYGSANHIIYTQLLEMHEDGSPIDLVSITSRFMDRDIMAKIGGPSILSEIYSFVPSPAHWKHYKDILKTKHILRSTITASLGVYEECFKHQDDLDALIASSTTGLKVLRDSLGTAADAEPTLADQIDGVMQELEGAMSGKSMYYLPTPFPSWNKTFGGHPKHMVLVKGEKGVGKTKLTMLLCRHLAMQHHKPVVIFSMEMSAGELIKRMICEMTGIASGKLFQADVDPPNQGEMRKIGEALREINKNPIYIYDHRYSVGGMRARLEKVFDRHKEIGAILVDHINRVKKPLGNTLAEQLGEISDGILELSTDYDCGIYLLTHMNKQGAARNSEASENDSPIIVRITSYGIVVEKNRNGKSGEDLPIGSWNSDDFGVTEDARKSQIFKDLHDGQDKVRPRFEWSKTPTDL